MTPHQPRHPLPWTQKLSYGLPAFALAVVGIPVYVHIPKFYTDVVGVNITWVGTILMLARLFDAFSDPLIGVISDRSTYPHGAPQTVHPLGQFLSGGGHVSSFRAPAP